MGGLTHSEQEIADLLLDHGARPLQEYRRKKILSGKPEQINWSVAANNIPMVYVTEDRIKDKFSYNTDFMFFPYAMNLSLIPPRDQHYRADTPLVYCTLKEEFSHFHVAHGMAFPTKQTPIAYCQEYRVSLDNLFMASGGLSQKMHLDYS